MLDIAALTALVASAQHDIFRMETLPAYAVPSDGGDYRRYLSGGPGPEQSRIAAWHAKLRAERARGVRRWRVYAAHEPLSDYARFECEWGHAMNAALEDIRVLPASAPEGLVDFLVIDDHTLVTMHYTSAGEFTGAEMLPPSALAAAVRIRDSAWEAAEPFTQWWDARPQYHRRVAA